MIMTFAFTTDTVWGINDMFWKQVVVKTAAFEIFGTVEKQGIFGWSTSI